MDEFARLSATDAVAALARREASPLELIDVAEARIAEVEPAVNALPTTCFERARRHARALADRPSTDPPAWYLHGLPIAVKDLVAVSGVRTTLGSVVHRDDIPTASDIMVDMLEAGGALVVAKSNVPEFGAGSHTFNDVFGPTRNPWDTTRSAGGSSGGAAAALATGEVWLADGSDLGGSLRNPASFCGVVGIRPGPGRVARGPVDDPWDTLSVRGPMGRTVADAALMLDAMAGAHPADPLSLPRPAERFHTAALQPTPPRRVGFTVDLGGITPVDPEVAAICRQAAERMSGAGVAVEEASIDFTGAASTFHVLRAMLLALDHEDVLAHRDLVKDEVVWNVEAGLALGGKEIAEARLRRGQLAERVTGFFGEYDVLACPAAIVAPFPVEWRWPEEVSGHRFETYIDWLLACSAISLTSCPALSVPCGLTSGGLPVGLQLVAPPGGEHALISVAAWWEVAAGLARLVPRDPRQGDEAAQP